MYCPSVIDLHSAEPSKASANKGSNKMTQKKEIIPLAMPIQNALNSSSALSIHLKSAKKETQPELTTGNCNQSIKNKFNDKATNEIDQLREGDEMS